MKGNPIAKERYLELTALLIDREIAKFRRGEQVARVSFANVAKLATNACNELMTPWHDGAHAAPRCLLSRQARVGAACKPADDERVCVHGLLRGVLISTASSGTGSNSYAWGPV